MGQVEKSIRDKLERAFCPRILEVLNESPQHQTTEGAETHFRVLLVSTRFSGLSKVLRHQMVYKCLKEEIEGPVHAFSQNTFTPEEWNKLSSAPATPPCAKTGPNRKPEGEKA